MIVECGNQYSNLSRGIINEDKRKRCKSMLFISVIDFQLYSIRTVTVPCGNDQLEVMLFNEKHKIR